jgi:hypothetical protein
MLKRECLISKATQIPYEINTKRLPLLLCDILGFKNLVKEKEPSELTEIILAVIDGLNYMKLKNIGKEYFKSNNSFYQKLSDNFPEKYNFNFNIVSDTILIYPEVELEESPLNYEIEILLISLASMNLFEYMLKNHLLIRGAIHYGEFYELKEPRLLFGKTVIEAYELESYQDWGGILLSPKICEVLRKSHILNIIYNEYLDVPIKANYEAVFHEDCLTHIAFPHVLNWTRLVHEINWKPFYDRVELISDETERKKVNTTIKNTEIFYNKMMAK